MRSRVLLNLGLLALVVVLGLTIFNLRDDSEDYQLTTLKPDDITAIEIQHRDRYMVLKKQDNGWRMTRPINIPANNFRVNSLLKLINTTAHASYDTSQLNLSRYKLDKPRTTLRIFDGNQDTLIAFGSSNPINRMRYVMVGERMFLIDDNFYPLASSQIGALISPRLLPDVERITRLQLPELRIEQTDEGKWRLTPDNNTLSADDISALIDEWLHAEAFGVHDYMQRKQLGDIDISVIRNGAPQTLRFMITDTEPWLILARPDLGIEYHLNAESYDKLLRPDHLQDKAVLDAEQQRLEQDTL